MLIDDKASIRKIDMNVLLKKISIEKQIINRELFFAIGFCPEIGQHLLCVHISWIAGYDRYYDLEDGDVKNMKKKSRLTEPSALLVQGH